MSKIDLSRMIDQIMRMTQERHDFSMQRANKAEYYSDLASGRKKSEAENQSYLDRLLQKDKSAAELEKQRVTDIGAMARQTLISKTGENVANIGATASQNVANINAASSNYVSNQSRGSALDVANTNLLGTQYTANKNLEAERQKAGSAREDKNLDSFSRAISGIPDTLTAKERQEAIDEMKGVFGIGPIIPGDTISRDNGVTPPATVMPRQATPPPPAPAAPAAPATVLPSVSNGKTPPVVGAPTAPPQQIMAPVPKKKKTEMNPGAQKAAAMLGDFYSRFKMPPAGNLYIPGEKQKYY